MYISRLFFIGFLHLSSKMKTMLIIKYTIIKIDRLCREKAEEKISIQIKKQKSIEKINFEVSKRR